MLQFSGAESKLLYLVISTVLHFTTFLHQAMSLPFLLLNLLLQLLYPVFQQLHSIYSHGSQPGRIKGLVIQPRTKIGLLDKLPREAHPKICPAVVFGRPVVFDIIILETGSSQGLILVLVVES